MVLHLLARGYSLAQCSRKALLSPDVVRVIAEQALEDGVLEPPVPPDPAAKERALVDFDYFRQRYFGRVVMPWQSDAGKRLVELKDDHAKEFVVLNVFPGSGKTTLFAHDLACFFAVRDRSLRILIGSRTLRQAQMYSNRLRRTFSRLTPAPVDPEEIERGLAIEPTGCLTEDFGRFSPIGREEMWTADQFVLFQWGRAVTEKEASFTAFGMDSGFLGGRFDIVVWDDLVDHKTLRTVEAKEALIRLYEDEVESRLDPGGLLVLQGQRMRTDDLYRHALDMRIDADLDAGDEGRPKYHHIVYRAHHEDRCKGIETHGADVAKPWPDGCLLDPKRLPWREIQTIRANREEKWAVLYQQEDVDPDKVLVQRIWIDGGINAITGERHPGCWDQDRGLAEIPAGITQPFLSVATCDPSPARYWCAAEGTLILTNQGERPIERVQTGDTVLTRAGWRRVRASAQTGHRQVVELRLSNGRTLRLTPEHLVATPSGWIPAGSLRPGEALCGANTGTRPAEALSVPDVEVLPGVGMPARAVRHGHLGGDVSSPVHVVPVGFHGQVSNLDTGRIAAQVRHLAAIGDWPYQSPIGQTMRELLSVPPQVFANNPIAAAAIAGRSQRGSLPYQASASRPHGAGQEVFLVDRDSSAGSDLPVPTGHTVFGLRTDDHRAAFQTLHVVSLTDGSYCDVYDLDVEDEHEFVAEGLVVHNSVQWWLVERATERRYLLDLIRSPLEAPEFLDWDHAAGKFTGIMENWQRRSVSLGAPITHWIVEINAARFLYQHDYVKRWQALHRVALIPHTTHLNRNDADFGVQTIGPHYKFGRVRLPGKDKVDGGSAPGRQTAMKLVDEVTRFPDSATDDCVLAHWFLEWNLPRISPPERAPQRQARPSWMAGDSNKNRPSWL